MYNMENARQVQQKHVMISDLYKTVYSYQKAAWLMQYTYICDYV